MEQDNGAMLDKSHRKIRGLRKNPNAQMIFF